jgi:hypothetical protein
VLAELAALRPIEARMKMTREEVEKVIEQFLSSTGNKWDWDDFVSMRLEDPELEQIRRSCAALPELYPPTVNSGYCDAQGLKALRSTLKNLKTPLV